MTPGSVTRRGFLGALAALAAVPTAAVASTRPWFSYRKVKAQVDQYEPPSGVWKSRAGISGDTELSGYEDELIFYEDKLEIDQVPKRWGTELAKAATEKSKLHKLMGEGPESFIRIRR